jgi:hypothetical protein
VLFIEEFQSDWAQKGRREGFHADARHARRREAASKEIQELAWTNAANAAERGKSGRTSTSRSGRRAHRSVAAHKGVPNAPFVGKTEAWLALALKRMIRYAAEHGYDRIAWTNGEQQAERYDLSKHIDMESGCFGGAGPRATTRHPRSDKRAVNVSLGQGRVSLLPIQTHSMREARRYRSART